VAWRFPDDRPFDLTVAGLSDAFYNCRLIEHDADTLTIDYDYQAAFGLIKRFRVQVRIEDVRAIYEHAVTATKETTTQAGEDVPSAVRGQSPL
jgi:hypothetical protein